MARKLTGIRRHRQGWRVEVRVRGHLYVKQFPIETPIQTMKDWRDDQVDTYGGTVRAAAGGLGEQVQIYLQRVAAMPTIAQHTAHLALWVHELGKDRLPLSVTSTEIDIVLQDWLETLQPGTVRKRRSALRSFYATMYPSKVSPVKGTKNPKPPEPEVRDLGYPALERAIAAMPDRRDTKKGLPPRVNLSKIRARVIAYTGLPPGLLQQVQPWDLVLTGLGSVRVSARRKGGGVEARTLPLTADGLAAFKAFHAATAYGGFAIESLNRSFKRGCKRAGLDPKAVHLYDARHTFLSQVYRVTRDLATVGRLGLHAEGSVVTARYAKGANQEVDAAAVKAFTTALTAQRQQTLKSAPGRPAAKQSTAKVNRRRKSFRPRVLKAG